jgi:hypothetical protein
MRLPIVLAACICAASSQACQSGYENTFDAVGPTATDIVAVQVEGLSLTSSHPTAHIVRGKIRVLRHYRGAGNFTELHYANTICAGLRIDVGGIYLIAVNANGPSIELNPFKAAILQLTGTNPFDPDYVLRTHPTAKRLEEALRADGNFQIATMNAQAGLVRETCPPPVPPPESFNDAANQ